MQTVKVTNPYDGSLIQEIALNNAADVDLALDKAHGLFQDQTHWIPDFKKIEILEKVIEIMSGMIDELAILAASEGGKPYADSKVEVLRAINGVKLGAEHIAQLKGEQIPMGLTEASVNRLAFTMREPIGIVASVSAFNHPLNLIIHQTIPAIAAGCPVIIKPARSTPLSCLKFIDILKQAGLPDGWAQALVLENKDASRLIEDDRINFFSFIGSGKVGWWLNSRLSPGTRSALEHGGAAPVIVEADADIKPMIDSLVKGGFYHAGQVCVSVQKIYVHESICKQVAELIADQAKKLIVGNQLNKNTEVGPLIQHAEVDRIEQWVNDAKDSGAKILCGGQRISDSCYQPTVLLNPAEDANVSQLEIFGPVVCVYSYKTLDEAINRANALPLAFQAAVFTENLNTSLKVVKKLNATAVMVNDHTAFRVDWMPFGGRDASGIGMGGIQYSMEEMTRIKMMVIKSPVI
ncbi:MAG: aldehyde dehydrogenase family protein [Proteobacteria bacterium]|nr:aldehyde dehydrogenase family protein [Pseudomonadota bacterium]